jgi:hypothetical protein
MALVLFQPEPPMPKGSARQALGASQRSRLTERFRAEKLPPTKSVLLPALPPQLAA